MSNARQSVGSLIAFVLLAVGATFGAALPAAAQDEIPSEPPVIVQITSASAAGIYTVDWQTLGGCDPGPDTSGMAGQVTLRVWSTGTPDDTPEPGELTGTPAVAAVVIRSICIYVWHVSFVEATTDANCVVGPAPFEPDRRNRIRITLDDPAGSCSQRSRIVVRLNPAVPVSVDDTDHNAILRTRFIATARRVADAPRRCSTRVGVSRVDDNDTPDDTTDDSASIELRVVQTTAGGEECRYDVTLRVPRRLAARHGDHDHNVFENVDPLATIHFTVGVATKTLLLLQTVVGDSGSAYARYELERTCGKPEVSDIPEPLLPKAIDGLVQTIEPVRLVELREGRHNITAALTEDPTAEDSFDGVGVRVLDHEGETCEATVIVSDLPDVCAVDETSQTVNLTRSPEPTIFEFEITCGEELDDSTGDEISEDSDPDDAADSGTPDTGNGGQTGTDESEGDVATDPDGATDNSGTG